jgi:GR25 family glycosyltransferase involved in LPS biosynthesis
MTDYKIFVINLDRSKNRMKYYKNIKGIRRWKGVDGKTERIPKMYLDKMVSLPSIKPKNHKTKVACFLSHYKLYEHIVKKKLNNVIICEDDMVIDPVKLKKLKLKKDGITFLAGWLDSVLVKDKKNFNPSTIRKTLKKGTNVINKKKYRILGTWGYHIPTWQIASELLDYLKKSERLRHIDIMLTRFEKTKYMYYPPPIYPNENAQESLLGHADIQYQKRNFYKNY